MSSEQSAERASRGQVNTDAAEVYDEFFVPALFGQWAEPVLDAAGAAPGDDLVDIGCGTGVVARRALARVGSDGHVVGIDPNDGMLAVAEQREPDVEWRTGVAEDLPCDDGEFDRAVCQFAAMFFVDRDAAIDEMVRVTRPGGTIAIATWADVAESPGYAAMVELLRRVVSSDAADALLAPFVLGDADELERLVRRHAPDAVVTSHRGDARFDSLDAWLHTDVRGWTLSDMIDDDTFEELRSAATRELRSFVGSDGRVSFPAPALIATGSTPG